MSNGHEQWLAVELTRMTRLMNRFVKPKPIDKHTSFLNPGRAMTDTNAC